MSNLHLREVLKGPNACKVAAGDTASVSATAIPTNANDITLTRRRLALPRSALQARSRQPVQKKGHAGFPGLETW